jgi:hypothetical protein
MLPHFLQLFTANLLPVLSHGRMVFSERGSSGIRFTAGLLCVRHVLSFSADRTSVTARPLSQADGIIDVSQFTTTFAHFP